MEFDTGESRKGAIRRELGASSAEAIRLVTGNAGDHRLIHALLRTANQAPTFEEFSTWLEEPTYEPTDRLLVKRGGQILAHIQVLNRSAWFHGVRLPVGGVQDLATLPELHEAGYERLLVGAAEQTMRDHQAVLAFVRTDRPETFRSCGWSDAVGQRYTQANVSDILARLSSTAAPQSRRIRPLRIRLWRHVELEALHAVYHAGAAATWGALDRVESYWRWLVGRKAHNELIVAIHGKDQWEELDTPSHIVGFAVTRGSQVVELWTLPEFARAAQPLLARACQDAIERDHRSLSLHSPITDPLHELLLLAGGRWSMGGRNGGGTMLVKLLDPVRWLESLYTVLLERAKAANISRPFQIAFAVGRRKYRLELTRRSGHLVCDDGVAADVSCTPDVFHALLVGNVEVAAARQASHLEIRDDETALRLAALFPPVAFWQSQFDTPRF